MKLLYYQTTSNFGDVLNVPFWNGILGKLPGETGEAETRFIGIGTLLSDKLEPVPRTLVAGAGTGYHQPPSWNGDWYFAFVRGPLTARRLGLPESLGIGDPAYIADEVLGIAPPSQRRGTVFIPHCDNDLVYQWGAICRSAGIRYVSPSRSPEEVIRAIASASLVVTESMHGAIIADALRVPWIPVRIGDNILDFKWEDFCATIGIRHRFERLVPPVVGRKLLVMPHRIFAHGRILRDIVRNSPARLSDDAVHVRVREQLRVRLGELREALSGDWRGRFFPLSPSVYVFDSARNG